MRRLIHLSDPHFGAADLQVAEAFLETVRGMSPHLTLLSGDLTMRARRGELNAAKDFVDRLPEPRLVIAGNHDIPGMASLGQRILNPFKRFKHKFQTNLEPSLSLPGIEVRCLQTARAWGRPIDWSRGYLSAGQIRRLANGFEAREQEGLRVVMMHHPLVPNGEKGRAVVEPRAKLSEALSQARVDLLVCGHFHRSLIVATGGGRKGGWQPIISQAPTVCSTRLQGEPAGFHEISWEGQGLEITLHQHCGGSFVPVKTSRFQRTSQGWLASDLKT